MTVTDIINSTTITAVWAQLGGDQPRGGRARAFWRDGSDNRQAVSLSDEKGTWFDHRDGRGGGVLDLIATVECCTRVDALRWLAAFTGLPLDAHPLSPSERRAYSLARQEGAELAMWKDRLLVALLVDLHRWGRIYHRSLRDVRDHGLDSPIGDAAATVHEIADVRINCIHREIDLLGGAAYRDLIPLFRTRRAV